MDPFTMFLLKLLVVSGIKLLLNRLLRKQHQVERLVEGSSAPSRFKVCFIHVVALVSWQELPRVHDVHTVHSIFS